MRFQSIDCDKQAHRVLGYIEKYSKNPPHNSTWSGYFQAKLHGAYKHPALRGVRSIWGLPRCSP
ncbi:hypothetical protein H1P_3020002 [Hyella patelloides LEGE 07179]|uniref:Uncharacterized protein n=1 Tax=Hyella patelloides LEGE 07179 TaxID=945734 RepID=A0A563VUC7_9CYAN|nr:hypothetical protein H1P_3020002 [Hyella patelloides LEGE 07179]